MNSFSAVIDAFGGRFAEAIGVPDSHARAMKSRKSIPPTYWLETVAAAQKLGIEGITLDVLARLATEKGNTREAAQ